MQVPLMSRLGSTGENLGPTDKPHNRHVLWVGCQRLISPLTPTQTLTLSKNTPSPKSNINFQKIISFLELP